MADLFTIISAWKIARNPTRTQLALAEKRSKICETCPSKKTITKKLGDIGIICGECGCPLSKKIFSPKNKECPLNKWDDVEAEYFPKLHVEKTKKTLF